MRLATASYVVFPGQRRSKPIIRASSIADRLLFPHSGQILPARDLPDEALPNLLGSRYCDTEKLSDQAWAMFAGIAGVGSEFRPSAITFMTVLNSDTTTPGAIGLRPKDTRNASAFAATNFAHVAERLAQSKVDRRFGVNIRLPGDNKPPGTFASLERLYLNKKSRNAVSARYAASAARKKDWSIR